ncbi:FtsJ-like methyltransferase-domain-containing protein [Filobasidium floriforme]|uniref:FtsJ-like methyltransferase-domain-containing protein n=1 Tax=Filobasidium floriforme TaxID=5210 RepID=UPI001E8E86F8|nr:FtsJ-like methyltransferase-domain-containing protein [Filobasidium floriforme]KAH8087058.1 FtsJ-like methyltransferase-domain-containing protein [Filobasidium floriforme]
MSRSSADKRDIYYRLCKSEGYRARSAYKLLHLDEEFDLFRGVRVACDFCAAPGSWSQVLSRKLRPAGKKDPAKIVSIDLQPMAPLAGVTILHADITVPSTLNKMMDAMEEEKADLVVCDGAPEVTGVHDLDAYLHAQLLLAALTLALPLLAPGATLIFKIFLSPSDPTGEILISQLEPFFSYPQKGDELIDDTLGNPYEEGGCEVKGYDRYGRRGGVWVRKPRSSRAGSAEHFLVCRNFNPDTLPPSFDFKSLSHSVQSLSLDSFSAGERTSKEDEEKERRWQVIKGYTIGDLDCGR